MTGLIRTQLTGLAGTIADLNTQRFLAEQESQRWRPDSRPH